MSVSVRGAVSWCFTEELHGEEILLAGTSLAFSNGEIERKETEKKGGAPSDGCSHKCRICSCSQRKA